MKLIKFKQMEINAKFICYANLKGGAGKSSLTIQTANYLSEIMGKSVTIIDCDIAQQTCYKGWQMAEDPSFDVIIFNPSSPKEEWKNLMEEVGAYDYVFFDIPGTIFQQDIITLLAMMDAIIVTTLHSTKDLASTRSFIDFLRENGIADFKILLNKLRAYRDLEHQSALDEISSGKEGPLSKLFNVSPNTFFKNHFNDEQAAIEKNMEISLVHPKMERYRPFFDELIDYVNQ